MKSQLLPPLLFAAACSADAGEGWTGTVSDSAGITIVSNPAEGVWSAGEAWTVEETLRIGVLEGDADYLFGHIAGICVGSGGGIFAVDQGATRVAAYSADGVFRNAFGEAGDGPGQLGAALGGCLMGPGDTLHVTDLQNLRIDRYGSDGSIQASFPIDLPLGLPVVTQMTGDGRLVQQRRSFGFGGQPPVDSVDALIMLDARGVLEDTLLVFPTGQTISLTGGGGQGVLTLFASEPAWAVTSSGELYYATTDAYSIGLYDRDRTLRRLVRRAVEPRRVEEADRQLITDALAQGFRDTGAPEPLVDQIMGVVNFAELYPAFHRLASGPQATLWVQRVQTADELSDEERQALGTLMQNPEVFITNPLLPVGAPDWDVFDADGRYLGAVTFPERFEPMVFRDGEIYGVWKDEVDVEYVMRFLIHD